MYSYLIAMGIIGAIFSLLVYFDFEWYEALGFMFAFCIFFYFLFMVSSYDYDLQKLLKFYGVPDLFKNINGFDVTAMTLKPDMASTYGEIMSKGVENIYKMIRDDEIEIDTFIDMGSGIGKAVVLGRMWGFDKCIGVELNKNRHWQATEVYDRLPENLKTGVSFHHMDAMDYNLRAHTKPLVIFVSNLLWPQKMIADFMHKVVEEAPDGTYVICSKLSYYIADKPRLRNVKMLNTPMSWDLQSQSFVLEIMKDT